MQDFQLPIPPLPIPLPADLLAQAKTIDLVKGEYLFRQKDAVSHVIFVLEGELKAVRHLPDGGECVMLRSRAGELFAESSLADNQYRCDGVATESARVALVPVDMLRTALGGEGSLAFGMCMALARQARKQCSRQERLRLKRARDRVLHFLACEGGVEGVVHWSAHLSELASELGLERETLYRALAALEEEGLLQRVGEKLRLINQRD
jgi:CRP/FNR family transcriptional regulator, dissimilatory nitrate respiration regulator